ncbi:translation protein SH3-like domain-containing protein [Neohortaea acidophila]|uniref:Translation protein SH3-like domain-containing protein n=1 Tax=Neohortaea acidophila TaxID=245834 RepID=A0A6A6PU66_9PEZI|nr:translation protein SH3-like domain-containing protein [Neohortaea acidophila]KAF2483306.1 translation protein SH3-like domain-containing protein [Neohortaea acidophila]
MSAHTSSVRPLAHLKHALRQCRLECDQRRRYAVPATDALYPSLQTKYPLPAAGFRPSQAIKQNRFEPGLKRIRVFQPPRSTIKLCPDPIQKVTQDQLAVLDPTGARTRLFAASNPDNVKPGDVLLVRLKNGEPFAGACINIRQRNSPIDTAVLLRNQLTRVGVEMWVKVYSPNVEGIEIVQRKERRARRAKLYYMRKPKHDMGNLDGVVRQYLRQKVGGQMSSRSTKGREANAQKKKKDKKKSDQRGKK